MEVIGGLVIAEEVITHTLEGGAVAAVALGKPTLPLKAKLSQFARAPEKNDPESLARAHHTVNLVDGDLYIFGGATGPAQLATNDMHVIKLSNKDDSSSQYKCIPALGRDGEKHGVPPARASHSACSIGERILIFGGTANIASQTPIDQGSSRVWVFDTKLLQWSAVDAESGPSARSGHSAVAYDGNLMVIHGGVGADSSHLSDTWAFNIESGTWSQLPALPVDSSTVSEGSVSFAEASGSLYVVTHSSNMTAVIHTLDLKGSPMPEWQTSEIPIAFPDPGPRPRKGAGLVPLHTGQGRTYLLYIFGASPDASGATKPDEPEKLWSGIWALQLPATGGAHAKDVVRESIGLDSKESAWAEVEIAPLEQSDSMQGKAHPGPRAYFGCDVLATTQKIILWGGQRPDGSFAGDGWVVEFNSPKLSGMLKKIPGVRAFVKDEE